MRVLVTGGYGLIGSACLARLHAAGHDLAAAGRSLAMARRRFAYARWIEADFTRLTSAQAWLPPLAGVEAIVNCVGVLQDGAGDDVQRVQYAATAALFDACARAGVKRVVHISAVGAEANGPSAFARSKAAAEAHLKTLPLDWVILRPALVVSPAAYGSTAMLRAVAAFPSCVPLVAAEARVQTVAIDDLTATVARALLPDAPGKVVWEVAHPQVHTLGEIAVAIRAWLGFAPRRVLPIPAIAGKIIARIADAIGWLGWRSPARSTALAQLGAGVVGDPRGWMAATGITPQSFADTLAAHPANVQDRWFARLYLLKPLAVVAIAGSAIAIGLAMLASYAQLTIMTWRQISLSLFATEFLPGLGDGAIELILGLALLVRRTARIALLALLALAALGTVENGLVAASFGHFPSTALLFYVPAMLALLFTLAILDGR